MSPAPRNACCCNRSPIRNRRGAITVLVGVMLVLFIMGLAFSVDVAYMQLARTELQVATDAAAKAAVVTLSQGGNAGAANKAAIDMAHRNTVDGRPLTIDAQNVALGSLVPASNGSWSFVAGQQPLMAAQISVNMLPDSRSGPVNLFFAPLLGTKMFSPQNTATAGYVQNAVCLVLDRSGSMCWDLSGEDWSYPPGTPAWPKAYVTPPHPTKSRWGALTGSVKLYIKILKQSPDPSPVSLVTWASDIPAGSVSGLSYPASPATTVDVPFGSNQGVIESAIDGRGKDPMIGATNMSAGMLAGLQVLQNYSANRPVNRVMILLTDGQWNDGADPLVTAQQLQQANIKVHTIGLLIGSMQATLAQISQMTGGLTFMAQNEADLDSAFEQLAKDLPVILTK